ncbi:MAG TPA: S41 family peptidase [Cyclobacteriaceae bacterium]|nr:S41 family peptidase [Cyclobacteriaceae bacterium]
MRWIVFSAICLFGRVLFAQPNFREEATRLATRISANHVAPKPIDDALSKSLFDSFLEKIDPEKIYFTEEEITQLRHFQLELDDEFTGKKWDFLARFIPVLKKNLARSFGYITDAKMRPILPTLKQPLTFSYSPSEWARNEDQLKQRWRNMFVNEVYESVFDLAPVDSIKPGQMDDSYFIAREPAARTRTGQAKERRIRYLQNPSEGFEAHIASVFLNSFASCFDPHSSYLSSGDMEKFTASFAAEGYFFGFSLEESKNGKVQVAHLIPGSPAWRSGQLNVSDQIIAVKNGNKKIDLTEYGAQEAEQLINQSGNEPVEITVKKPSGAYRSVTLKKEKIELQENVVRGYVLKEEKKVGYIALPGFYTASGEKTEGVRCANDVAKEIIKLGKENIEGLIFDLRNNGGGSLQEALSMAGIFIEEGPLGMIKDKSGVAHVVKDINRGTVYDGPLLILINKLSASASEFLAAALQDYNRALVVGSNSFGKATAQIILSLGDEKSTPAPALVGFSKVTIDKVYRVTGKTIQGRGLTPDIALPDLLQPLMLGESMEKNYLAPDSVNRKLNFAKLAPLNVALLKEKSAKRLSALETFRSTQSFIDWFNQQRTKTFAIGSWKDYVQFAADFRAGLMQFQGNKATVKFQVLNSAIDQRVLTADAYREETNRHYVEDLKNDVTLQECYEILKDFISLTAKK